MKSIYLLVAGILFFSSILSFGQLQETQFYDQEPKEGYVKASTLCGTDIVMGGVTVTKNGLQVTLTKITNTGTILWVNEVAKAGQNSDGYEIWKLITGSDGAIYLLLGGDQPQVMKLNASDGLVIWSKPVAAVEWTSHLVDYSADKLLISFPASYNGSDYSYKAAFVDKATGDITTHLLGKVNWNYPSTALAADAQGNIYYTLKDTVYSISGTAPYALRWKRKHASADAKHFQHIHIDNNNRLFLFGSSSNDNGLGIGIDPTTGDFLWKVATTTQDASFNALAENTTHLFVAWQPLSNFYTGWFVAKIEKATGSLTWRSAYNLNGVQVTSTLDDDNESAKDLMLDADGNVILTGTYNGTTWGVLKLDGSTGVRLYEKLIQGDPPIANGTGNGVSLYSFGSKVDIIGNISTYRHTVTSNSDQHRSTAAFATIDPASGEVITQNSFYGDYEFPSQILGMERVGEDIVVLKKIGRSLQLGRYSADQNAKWEKTITEQYLMMDGKMHVTASGKIAIVARRYGQRTYSDQPNLEPSVIDVLFFDADGTQKWKKLFGPYDELSSSGTTFKLIDLHADENSVFVFNTYNQEMRLRKVSESEISSSVLVDIIPHRNAEVPYVFDDTGTEIRVAGTKNGIGDRIISFDKNNLTATITPFLYPTSGIRAIHKLNADEFVISGDIYTDGVFRNFIMRYNLTLSQTVWTTVLGDSKDWIAKYLVVSDKFIVTCGTYDYQAAFYKLEYNRGEVLHKFVNNTLGIKNTLADAVFDEASGEVVFVGSAQQFGSTDRKVMLGSLNFSDLKLRHLEFLPAEYGSDNAATSVEVASDGNLWIGGYKNATGLHKPAFIYAGHLADPVTDTHAPLVTRVAPRSSTNKPTTQLVVAFNEHVTLGTGKIKIYTENTPNVLQLEAQIDLTPANTEVNSRHVVITPELPLPNPKTIILQIDSGAFKDNAGNAYAGNRDKRWMFSTDGQAPALLTKKASGFAIPVIELGFNEPVFVSSGNIRVYSSSGTLLSTTPVSAANASTDGKNAIVTLSEPFPLNTTVHIKVDGITFRDAAGNSWAGIYNTSWSHTCVPDTSPPYFTNIIPNVSSTVNPNNSLQLSFNEAILLNSGSLHVFDATNDVLLQSIALTSHNTTIFAPTEALITPAIPLPKDKNLYIKVDEGLLKDLAGNSFAGIQDKSWSFSTSTSPNMFVGMTPAPGTTEVSPYVALTLEFTQTMRDNHGYGTFSMYDYDTDEHLMTFQIDDINTKFGLNRVFVESPEPLPSGKHVYVKVGNGAIRTLSISPQINFEGFQDKQWHFTTKVLLDNQSPLLLSTSPANNDNAVSVYTDLQMNFSEPIVLGTGNLQVFVGSSWISSIALTPSNTVVNGSQVTITLPGQPFPVGGVSIHIDPGTFTDEAGNAFAGIGNNNTWWGFTTDVATDITPPTLVTTDPANGAIEVEWFHEFMLAFSERVYAGNGNITMYDGKTHGIIDTFPAQECSFDSSPRVFMSPDYRIPGMQVYITIDSGAFVDEAGNAFKGIKDTDWSFTLGGLPKVVSMSPEHAPPMDYSVIDPNITSIQLTFDRELKEYAISGSDPIKIYAADYSNWPDFWPELLYEINYYDNLTSIVVEDSTATIHLPGPLPHGHKIYVVVPSGMFTSYEFDQPSSGIELGDWSFYTDDTEAPTLLSKIPAENATEVDPLAAIIVTFSEKVDTGLSSESSVIKVFDEATDALLMNIPGSAMYRIYENGFDKKFGFKPQGGLPPGKKIYLQISYYNFRDYFGHPYAGLLDKSWSFTTAAAPDTQAPTIVETIPAAGETRPEMPAVFRLTFSEPVVLGSGGIRVYDDLDNELYIISASSNSVFIQGTEVTIPIPITLPYDKQIYIKIDDTVFKDQAGNAFAGIADKSWWFIITDTDKPVLNDKTPAPGTTGVAVTPILKLTFNEMIELGTGTIGIYDQTTNTVLLSIPISESTVSIVAASQATIQLTSSLPYNKQVYVKVDDTAFKDVSGNTFEGITDTSWSFTTKPSTDVTGPVLTARLPGNSATNVDTTTNLTLTFNEQIQLGGGNITLYDRTTNAQIEQIVLDATNVTISGTKAIITLLNDLPAGKSLYVQVDAGSFLDAVGNPFIGIKDKSWSFTTISRPVDNRPPGIVSLSPTNRSTDVDPFSTLAITFDETVKLGTGEIKLIYNENGFFFSSILDVGSTNTTILDKTVTITPATPLPSGKLLNVVISKGLFTDLKGNQFAGTGIGSWTFSTQVKDELGPLLMTTEPETGAVGVEATSLVSLTFNEPIQVPTIGKMSIYEQVSNNLLSSFNLNATNATVDSHLLEVQLPFTIAEGKKVYITLEPQAIKDTAGNSFSGIRSNDWQFSTIELVTDVDDKLSTEWIDVHREGEMTIITPLHEGVSVEQINDTIGRTLMHTSVNGRAELPNPVGVFVVRCKWGQRVLAKKFLLVY